MDNQQKISDKMTKPSLSLIRQAIWIFSLEDTRMINSCKVLSRFDTTGKDADGVWYEWWKLLMKVLENLDNAYRTERETSS